MRIRCDSNTHLAILEIAVLIQLNYICISSATGWTQTINRELRRFVLYSVELLEQIL